MDAIYTSSHVCHAFLTVEKQWARFMNDNHVVSILLLAENLILYYFINNTSNNKI